MHGPQGGAWFRGVCMVPGVHGPGVVCGGDPPTTTAAGATHPTGMHSCSSCREILLTISS